MTQYIFDEDPELGGVVKKMKPFSKLWSTMPRPTEKYVVGDFADPNMPGLAGKKWSRLCGFTFKMKNGSIFQFVFVPKLKGTMARNQRALSGWYCWTILGKDVRQVTSIDDVYSRFGFSIYKFVNSDVFDKYVEIFLKNITYVLDNQIEQLKNRPVKEFENYREFIRFINAVRDSLSKIYDVKNIIIDEKPIKNTEDDENHMYDYSKYGEDKYNKPTPKVGHPKIAYNADKTYDLRNIDKAHQSKDAVKVSIGNTPSN